jgi:alkanesulfonate monooxygenase SsuD/methylene tetrahydromethanopterin reductase-like flavin-dependent oxidoreductase (luciferase family)
VTSRLRIGVQLPEVERDVRWQEYVSMARIAEEVGFDSIWLGDHLLYREHGRPERGPWEVWTLLAGLAAITERVQLGPLVACTAFHPPAVLAKMAATVDEVSGGRLVLGLGAGWNEADFTAFGIPFDHPASRFEEAFEIIRRLLAGERVTYSGRYSSVEDAVLLPKATRSPPLMIGSTGPRILRAALPHVESWNSWYDLFGNTPEGFAADSEKVSAIAEQVGRPPEEIERSACVSVALAGRWDRRHVRDDIPPIEGDPAVILRRAREFGDAGADEVILILSPCTEESIRALGEAL